MNKRHTRTHEPTARRLPPTPPAPMPGFACPVCRTRVSFSLDAFLYQSGHTCVGCGTRFEMDRAASRQSLEDVEQIKVARDNIEQLRRSQNC